jgi:hypothetical protein
MGAKLPATLGSFASLVAAFVSFMAQVSPIACAGRALTAFAVFAAFGMVIRYLLEEAAQQAAIRKLEEESKAASGEDQLIQPGTSVRDLLPSEPIHDNGMDVEPMANAA